MNIINKDPGKVQYASHGLMGEDMIGDALAGNFEGVAMNALQFGLSESGKIAVFFASKEGTAAFVKLFGRLAPNPQRIRI